MTAKLTIARVLMHRDQIIVQVAHENDQTIVMIKLRVMSEGPHLQMQTTGVFCETETGHQLVSSENNLL